jgi:hypothetical protein
MFTLMGPKTFYRGLFDFRRDFDEIFNHLNFLASGSVHVSTGGTYAS